MCTVGNVFDRRHGRVLTFKQCDLQAPTTFLHPEVREGEDGILYVVFEREGGNGAWAGFQTS